MNLNYIADPTTASSKLKIKEGFESVIGRQFKFIKFGLSLRLSPADTGVNPALLVWLYFILKK